MMMRMMMKKKKLRLKRRYGYDMLDFCQILHPFLSEFEIMLTFSYPFLIELHKNAVAVLCTKGTPVSCHLGLFLSTRIEIHA